MRESDWMNYEERLDAVAAQVSEHLDQPLDLIRLAEVAGLSPRYWHRVFTSAFGETPASFVKRARLQRAAFMLANSPEPITQIAAACGYPNVPSFTRAFAAAYGIPPGRYRTDGTHAEFRRARESFDPLAFEVEIRQSPPIECLAVAHRGPYSRIDEAFKDLEVWYAAHGYAIEDQELFGVFLSDPTQTPEPELRSLACFPRPAHVIGDLAPLSDGAAQVVEYTIAGGAYGVLTHVGPYADMPAKYEWLFGCWALASGLPIADQPVVEHYVNLPRDSAAAELVTQMWLPLAEDAGRPETEQ